MIATDGKGASSLGWSTKTETRVAKLLTDGRIGTSQSFPGILKALAAAPDGRVLLVTDERRGRALRGRLRQASDASFSPPERIAGTQGPIEVRAEFSTTTSKAIVTVYRILPPSTRTALVTATRR